MKSLLCCISSFLCNINLEIIEKNNPKTKKRNKIIRSKCDICGKNKSQIFAISEGVDMINLKKRGKCKHGHCSQMPIHHGQI